MSSNFQRQRGGGRGTGTAQVVSNGALEMPRYAAQQWQSTGQQNQQVRTNAVRTNAALPPDTWEQVDQAVYDSYVDTTVVLGDLRGANLTQQVDINAKINTWSLRDGYGEAQIDMDPETAATESNVGFGMDGVPVPIVHDDFSLGFRDNPSGSLPGNQGLDTLGLETCTRHVTETLENMVLNGWEQSITHEGDSFKLWGLTNHPDVNTGTLSADWSVDNTVIRSDIRRMRSVLKNDNRFSPGGQGYWLYLSPDYNDELDDADPEGSGDSTIRDRVENLSNIGRVREADYLPNKSALMLRPTSDVVDLGIAADIQSVQWEEPFRDYWKVLASIFPRVKSRSNGESGIAFFQSP